MAKTFRLANEGQTITYDFLTGALYVVAGSWQTRTGGDGRVTETMLLSSRDTDANIVTALDTLQNLIYLMREFFASTYNKNSVWLEMYAAAETGKRALIYDMVLQPVERGRQSALMGVRGATYELAIVRDEEWEVIAGSTQTGLNLSALGGALDVSAFDGDRMARIRTIKFTGDTGTQYTLWAGVKPIREGGSYTPVWELEGGTQTDATPVNIATASPGGAGNNCSQVTDARFTNNPGMQKRVTIQTNEVEITPNYLEYVGRFHVLLRCKTGAATTVNLMMKHGYASSGSFVQGETYYGFADTNWRIVELGTVSIPPFPWREPADSNTVSKYFQIQIWAERTAGASTLDLDCLVLVPAEHFTKSAGSSLSAAAYTRHYTSEKGEQFAVGYNSSGEPNIGLIYSFEDWRFPPEGGRVVIVGETSTVQNYNDVIDLEMEIFEHYSAASP